MDGGWIELSQVKMMQFGTWGMNVPKLSSRYVVGDLSLQRDWLIRIKALPSSLMILGYWPYCCHHDIAALRFANMRHKLARNKFYAFALVAALFKELPGMVDCWDIVTSSFGCLIFHAYGHQWTCQLWYHPQKSEIWAFLMVERLWRLEHIDELEAAGLGKIAAMIALYLLTSRRGRRGDLARLGWASILVPPGSFKSQTSFQSKPTARSRKPKGLGANWRHILSIGHRLAKIPCGSHLKRNRWIELGELATDSSTVGGRDELWAKIELCQSSIKAHRRVTSRKRRKELHLSDSGCPIKELRSPKTDKWGEPTAHITRCSKIKF
ncbi:hypothetical protein BS47DRAFT_1369232 [Hydnum rufescens UP504]|uniref:Uncharacterized protein n=1 Tax=Hydnum rufescens UP504 TaxID=1448309 RepID=A0A9P6ADS0_9AGAM|nr:hypothetical protein BS47DRAFT_1369232 [Hydnum rufescens UP504]